MNASQPERQPRPKTSASFEYFLYAAIIAETGLAAFVYKTIFRDPDLARFNLYFGAFYFAFLAWSIIQLNNVHKRRKLLDAEPVEIKEPVAEPEHTRPALGLTMAQLAIVVVVFLTALMTFSWALKLLR
ncbi:MAG TPA: hypothetical protein VK724_12145 [Bryobacteraceae bacterium]|jgi:hypothetical protein|nr:hypothetical protein [Bryobacteraceae bacterium]